MGVPAGTDSLAPQNGTDSARVRDARARNPARASATERRMDEQEGTDGRVVAVTGSLRVAPVQFLSPIRPAREAPQRCATSSSLLCSLTSAACISSNCFCISPTVCACSLSARISAACFCTSFNSIGANSS
jgi:hypothetical protein